MPTTAYAQKDPAASCTLAYGGRVALEPTWHIAKACAWLKALGTAADALQETSAKFASLDERRVLAFIIHRPSISKSPTTLPLPPAGHASVHVYLTTPPRTLDARLRAALQNTNALEYHTLVLHNITTLAQEGQDLVQHAATGRAIQGANGDEPYFDRIDYIGHKLEALWIFHDVLEYLQNLWQEPAHVATRLRHALSRDAYNALLWCVLGEVYVQLDQPHTAVEHLNTALSLSPDLARAHYARGLGHLRLKQTALAEADFTTALQHQPNNTAWLRARGALYMLKREYAPMCQDFTIACALGDCDGLTAARARQLCLPELPNPVDSHE